MATSSILGGDAGDIQPNGTGTASLGPSDSTDSGSDTIGTLGRDEINSDSDRHGTGERAGVETMSGQPAADILPDHVETMGSGAPVGTDALDTDTVSLDDSTSAAEVESLESEDSDPEDIAADAEADGSDSDGDRNAA